MIGYYGLITFETSDKKVLNFNTLTYNSQGRMSKHNIIGKKPKTEYIGPGLDQVKFTINLNGNYGLKPREEMEKWIEIANSGEANFLVIGGKVLGKDKWIVKSINEIWEKIYNDGKIFSGKISVTFEEYI